MTASTVNIGGKDRGPAVSVTRPRADVGGGAAPRWIPDAGVGRGVRRKRAMAGRFYGAAMARAAKDNGIEPLSAGITPAYWIAPMLKRLSRGARLAEGAGVGCTQAQMQGAIPNG